MRNRLREIGRRLGRHRTATLALTALAVIFAVPLLVNNPAIVGASAAVRELPIYCVKRDDKCISLTFDAAWGNEDTQQLISILGKYNVKATFFVVGDWVDKFPQSVKALGDAGHEVMSHSLKHDHFAQMKREEIISDLNACNEKIGAVTGKTPVLFRCPYGEYDDHVINAVNSTGMTAIQWSVDSLDWKGIGADEITQRVVSKAAPGSIVLFHNAAEHTPEALPWIIERLLANGYKLLPVSELLLKGDYAIDHTGMQYSAAG